MITILGILVTIFSFIGGNYFLNRLFENCECVSEFVNRVGKSIDKIVEKNIGNRIIIVTYPEVIQAEIVYALELPPERMFRFFINTGSATQISYYENWASLKYSGYVPL